MRQLQLIRETYHRKHRMENLDNRCVSIHFSIANRTHFIHLPETHPLKENGDLSETHSLKENGDRPETHPLKENGDQRGHFNITLQGVDHCVKPGNQIDSTRCTKSILNEKRKHVPSRIEF